MGRHCGVNRLSSRMATPQNHLAELREVCDLRTEADFEDIRGRSRPCATVHRRRHSPACYAASETPTPVRSSTSWLKRARNTTKRPTSGSLQRCSPTWHGTTLGATDVSVVTQFRHVSPTPAVAITVAAPESVRTVCRAWASEIAAHYEPGNKYDRFVSRGPRGVRDNQGTRNNVDIHRSRIRPAADRLARKQMNLPSLSDAGID